MIRRTGGRTVPAHDRGRQGARAKPPYPLLPAAAPSPSPRSSAAAASAHCEATRPGPAPGSRSRCSCWRKEVAAREGLPACPAGVCSAPPYQPEPPHCRLTCHPSSNTDQRNAGPRSLWSLVSPVRTGGILVAVVVEVGVGMRIGARVGRGGGGGGEELREVGRNVYK
eukprot:768652-Hanusia_phi.AAC.1